MRIQRLTTGETKGAIVGIDGFNLNKADWPTFCNELTGLCLTSAGLENKATVTKTIEEVTSEKRAIAKAVATNLGASFIENLLNEKLQIKILDKRTQNTEYGDATRNFGKKQDDGWYYRASIANLGANDQLSGVPTKAGRIGAYVEQKLFGLNASDNRPLPDVYMDKQKALGDPFFFEVKTKALEEVFKFGCELAEQEIGRGQEISLGGATNIFQDIANMNPRLNPTDPTYLKDVAEQLRKAILLLWVQKAPNLLVSAIARTDKGQQGGPPPPSTYGWVPDPGLNILTNTGGIVKWEKMSGDPRFGFALASIEYYFRLLIDRLIKLLEDELTDDMISSRRTSVVQGLADIKYTSSKTTIEVVGVSGIIKIKNLPKISNNISEMVATDPRQIYAGATELWNLRHGQAAVEKYFRFLLERIKLEKSDKKKDRDKAWLI